eukprot:1162054-Pelagomonas_calceolata.AAC.11
MGSFNPPPLVRRQQQQQAEANQFKLLMLRADAECKCRKRKLSNVRAVYANGPELCVQIRAFFFVLAKP